MCSVQVWPSRLCGAGQARVWWHLGCGAVGNCHAVSYRAVPCTMPREVFWGKPVVLPSRAWLSLTNMWLNQGATGRMGPSFSLAMLLLLAEGPACFRNYSRQHLCAPGVAPLLRWWRVPSLLYIWLQVALCWAVLGCAGLCQAVLGCAGAVLGCIRLCQAVPAVWVDGLLLVVIQVDSGRRCVLGWVWYHLAFSLCSQNA